MIVDIDMFFVFVDLILFVIFCWFICDVDVLLCVGEFVVFDV